MLKSNYLKQEQRKYLFELARQTLEHYFKTGEVIDPRFRGNDNKKDRDGVEEVPFELKQKRGTFVTLTKHGLLRGCIGHIEPVQEIYRDVIENTLLAAFEDNRFTPLLEKELKDIEIEISILSEPQKLIYSGVEDLLNKLRPGQDGVIIEKDNKNATYLPQVWGDFKSKEDFLSSLCEKAGLEAGEWKSEKLRVKIYQAEVFQE